MPAGDPKRCWTSTWLALATLFAILLLGACDREIAGEGLPNQPPQIYLSSGPLHGDPDTNYRVHFYWNGYDPDGRVDYFEFLITDDEVTGSLLIDEGIYETLADLGYEWSPAYSHDSTFTVSADSIPDLAETGDSIYFYGDHFLFHAQHTFFVRAVDEEGLHSSLPKHRSFTATTIAPEVKIVFPSDLGGLGGYDNLPTEIFFRWSGNDSVGNGNVIEPDSTRFALLRRGDLGLANQTSGLMLSFPDSIWSLWRHWESVDSLDENVGGQRALIQGLTPTSAGDGLGYYIFLVQAKDEAGAISSHYTDGKNLRKLRVISSLQPLVLVNEPSLGTSFTQVDRIYDFSVAEDQPLNLSWSASASSYGSEITGYRYGWDILDVANDDEWTSWSLSNTSASASYPSGTHTFTLEARDYSGMVTRVVYRFYVVPFSMEYEMLFIDDYDNTRVSDPQQGWPDGLEYTWGTFPHNQSQHMSWWWDVLSGYSDFIPQRDFFRVNVVDKKPYIEILGQYRRVTWDVRESEPGESGLARVATFVDPYATNDNIPYDYLGAFLDRGGQAFICGTYPVFAMLPRASWMGDPNYERKGPIAFQKHLRYSQGSPNESAAAVQRFLPWRHFGIDTATKPVDSTPRQFSGSGSDLRTTRTFWGMVAAGYPGDELAEFPISSGWVPGDTLFFRPEVYEWFAAAGPVFNDPDDWDNSAGTDFVYFGLNEAEIYNWDFFATVFNPHLDYRQDQYRALLTYIPADSTTRWGVAPAEVHPYLRPNGLHYEEAKYSSGDGTPQMVGIVSLRNPDKPNVMLGLPPFFLEPEAARGLIDHIFVDLFGMHRQ